MAEKFAVFEQMVPMGWIGDRPEDWRLARQTETPVPESWQEVVLDRQLNCGVAVTMQRGGFTTYDVGGWAAGMPVYASGRYRTVGEASKVELPALVQRLRLVNAHLALLHSASVKLGYGGPPVLRVRASDLYWPEGPYDNEAESWSAQGVRRRAVVQVADLRRLHDLLGLEAAEAALDWLDLVVSDDALLHFDLLNRGLDALGNHDFSNALGALWQICEFRLGRLARRATRPISPRAAVADITRILVQERILESEVARRLDVVRAERNNLIHRGTEPNQAAVDECLKIATTLLRSAVPELKTQAPMHLIIM